jgi:uncharacterized protein YkwD
MSRARTPILLALACAALLVPAGAAGAQAPSSTCAGADTPAVAGNEPAMDQATLCLLNQQRAAAGLPALSENPQLDQASTAYSHLMVAESFFDHVSPQGSTMVQRLTAVGYLPGTGGWAAGENIAWGEGPLATPRSIMTAWMNSPPHRANILSPAYAEIGLGVAIGAPTGDTAGAATYTTDFGRHVVAGSTVSVSPPAKPAATGKSTGKAPKPPAATRCAKTASTRRHGRAAHGSARTCRVPRSHARRGTASAKR